MIETNLYDWIFIKSNQMDSTESPTADRLGGHSKTIIFIC